MTFYCSTGMTITLPVAHTNSQVGSSISMTQRITLNGLAYDRRARIETGGIGHTYSVWQLTRLFLITITVGTIGTMPEKPKRAKPIEFNTSRPKPDRSNYDYLHQQNREALLAKFPYCVVCENAVSVHAHHRKYPARTIDDYMALCEACHKEQHKH